MDVLRAILDGIALAAIFNGASAALVMYNPRYLMDSYPKDIQAAAPEPMTKEEKKVNTIFTVIVMGTCSIYAVLSTASTDTQGFWPLFFTAYINWIIVNFADLFLLDCLLFKKGRKLVTIPGTEGHPTYEFKNWMKKLGLPEHLLLWPFLLVPFYALVQTGLVLLLRLITG